MILIAKPATEKVPQIIEIFTDNGNKFAQLNRYGSLILFGENEPLFKEERKQVNVIADNFDLFYSQLIRLQNEVTDLLTPTISRQ